MEGRSLKPSLRARHENLSISGQEPIRICQLISFLGQEPMRINAPWRARRLALNSYNLRVVRIAFRVASTVNMTAKPPTG